jgi:DNA/RNA-binding protein KIN17
MGKAEFGTPKYLAKQMKMKGLQKLKWYCQVCEKQCRDDNGFKCHIRSESHIKKISSIGKREIDNFSKKFQDNFISQLRNYHGEKSINANRFYNQLIQQKDHVHLTATRWSSLSQFIQDMSRQGIINAKITDETDQSLNGIDIAYINNSGDEVMRKAMLKQKTEAEKNDEALSAKLLEQQIKRGQQEPNTEEKEDDEEPVERVDQPIRISLGGIKKPAAQFKKTNLFKVSKPNSIKVKPSLK